MNNNRLKELILEFRKEIIKNEDYSPNICQRCFKNNKKGKGDFVIQIIRFERILNKYFGV